MCNKHKITIPEVKKRKVSVKIDTNKTTQYFTETIYDEMKINVFFLLLDDLIGEIDKRFLTKTLDIIGAVGNLIKLNLSKYDYTMLADYFKINVTELTTEVKLLKGAKNIPSGTCSHTVYKWLD